MHIRKLDIHGFKSFPERVTFHFGDGISGVVGPNGCGKSNVFDAVKWCIGEQSAKALRGQAMEDIIFNGSEGRAPSAVAEVSITLVASERPFPGEWARHEELQITRRLSRGGASEYLLNQQRVRLRDISDLFMDTGVGSRHYSFIEQGRIAAVVQATPGERRALIEEAAGISRFKARRAEALERLDASMENLQRSAHVVDELEDRLTAVSRQVEQAARYRRYRAIIRQGSLFVALSRYGALVEDRRTLVGQGRSLASQLEQAERELARREADLGRHRDEAVVQEQVVGEARDRMGELEATRRELESARMYQGREASDLDERASRAAAEVIRCEERQGEVETSGAAVRQRLVEEKGRLERVERELEEQVAVERGARDALADARRRADRARNELMERRATVERERARKDAQERRCRELEEALEQHDRTLRLAREEGGSLAQRRAQIEARQGAAEERQRELDALREGMASSLAAMDEALAAALSAEKDAAGNLAACERERAVAAARLEALAALADRHEGLADVSREVLGSVTGAFSIAEELEVPDHLIETVSQALGEQVDMVGLEAWADVERAVEAVRGGLAWLVCLDGQERDTPEGLLAEVGGTPRARAALHSLLGGLAVATDLAAARAMAAEGRPAIVPEKGALVRPQGLVRLGSPGNAASAVLGRRKRLAEATAEVEAASEAMDAAAGRHEQAAARVSEGRQRRDDARRRLSAHDEERRKAELETSGLFHQVRAAREAERRQAGRLGELEERAERDRARLDATRAELAGHQEAGKEVEGLLTEMEEQVADGDVAVRSAARQQAAVAEAARSLREEVVALKERARASEKEAEALAASLDEAHRSLVRAREDGIQVAARRASLDEQMVRTEESITEVAEQQGRVMEKLDQERGRLKKVRDEVRRREEEVSLARERRDGIGGRAQELEIKLQETRTLLETLKRQVEEDLGVSLAGQVDLLEKTGQLVIPHGLEADSRLPLDISRLPRVEDLVVTRKDLDDQDAAERWGEAIEKARRRLKALGDVNLAAVDEYLELSSRHTTLLEQRKDLEDTVAEIRGALARINRTCRERFKEAADAVNERFKELYGRLSAGGEAHLQFTNEDDLLETGIDIVASPPGKRLRHMLQLSGGENALVAIALVFALFQVKPSPFCLLDEVDAPLDEGNGARFNLLLKEMSRLSQFIVVTHNTKTMEAADTLYGVTMPKPGISRLVTVQVH